MENDNIPWSDVSDLEKRFKEAQAHILKLQKELSELKRNRLQFVTSWSCEEMIINLEKFPISRAYFFEHILTHNGSKIRAMIPDNISFRDLESLNGQMTKVTIEKVPWY